MRREYLWIAGIALVLGLGQWWATAPFGLGMTPDSFAYAGTAEWIVAGRGWGYWLEPQLMTWPLGYPTVLAGAEFLTDLGVRATARLVHLGLLVTFAVLVWRVAHRVLLHPSWRVGATAAVAGSTLIGALNRQLLTESLLGVVALGAFIVLVDDVLGRRQWPVWVLPTLLTAAFLTSYRGVFVGIAVIATVLIHGRGSLRHRTKRAAAVAVASAAVPAAYVLLNRLRGGEGYQGTTQVELEGVAVAREGLEVLTAWTVGRLELTLVGVTGSFVSAAAIAFAAVSLAAVWFGSHARGARPARVALTFGLVMFGLVVAARWLITFDLEARTLGMAFPSLALAIAGHGERAFLDHPRRAAWTATCAVWCLVVVGLGFRATQEFHDSGGASRTGAPHVATVDELERAREATAEQGCRPYSTDPLLSWLAGAEHEPWPPEEDPADPFCVFDVGPTLDEAPAGTTLVVDGERVAVYRSTTD